MLGGIISGIGSLIGATSAQKASEEANKLNRENLAFQKEQWNYNKNLQERIFQREDSAVQRGAQDLAAAGLSKTLAAGSGAGTGAVVAQTAPQNDISSTITPQLEMARIQQSMMSESVQTAMNMKQTMANIKAQEREQDRADLLAGVTIKAEDWKMGMGEKEFEQKIDEFKNLKSYQQFEKYMQSQYLTMDKQAHKSGMDTSQLQYDEMKRWLEFGDDKIHRELPTDIKMWMWQYNKTHSFENLGWKFADKAIDVLGEWGKPGGIWRGVMPTPSDKPFGFRRK